MANMIKQRCKHPTCINGSDCKEHDNNLNKIRDKYRGTPVERGYDTTWRKFRLGYLGRHPLCADCEEDSKITAATEVHHEKPILEYPELKYDENNLKALCKKCHGRRGNAR